MAGTKFGLHDVKTKLFYPLYGTPLPWTKEQPGNSG